MYLKKIINQYCKNNFCNKVTCTALETIVCYSIIFVLDYVCIRNEPPIKPIEYPKDLNVSLLPNIHYYTINEFIRKDYTDMKIDNKNK